MNKTLEEQIKEKEQELKRLRQIKKEQDAKTKRYVTFDVQGLFHFSTNNKLLL